MNLTRERERERKRKRQLFHVPAERRLQRHTCLNEPSTVAHTMEMCWRTTSLRVGFPRHHPSWVAAPFNSFSEYTWSKLIIVYNLCTATLTGLPAAISGQDEYLYAKSGSQIYEGYQSSTVLKETPPASFGSPAPKDPSLQGWEDGDDFLTYKLQLYYFTCYTYLYIYIYTKMNFATIL